MNSGRPPEKSSPPAEFCGSFDPSLAIGSRTRFRDSGLEAGVIVEHALKFKPLLFY
jgi:hypothetical protein